MTAELADRLRIRYTKLGKIRFTSQRDVARMWERALRRAKVPVAYTSGFSPRPLLGFSLALPTGGESDAEYLDVRLDPAEARGGEFVVNPQAPLEGPAYLDLAQMLTPLLPQGIDVACAVGLPHSEESLQEAVTSCNWELEVSGVDSDGVTEAVERLLSSTTVLVERDRKGRRVTDDVRPAVLALSATGPSPRHPTNHGLTAHLAMRPRGLRPSELLRALDENLVLTRARRTHQWIDRSDARLEPLSVTGQLPGACVPDHSGQLA